MTDSKKIEDGGPDLSALIEKLEKAERPNYALEVEIFKFFNPDYRDYVEGRGGLVHRNDGEDQRVLSNVRPPNVTASIDAAVSLAERVMPGWDWGMQSFGEDGAQGKVWKHGWHDDTVVRAYHASPTIALVLATLRALQSRGEA